MFEAAIERLLAELEELGRENDQRISERRYKLLNLERPTAELIWLLLQSTRRRSVLEIGTSNGYSTIWIAEALRCAPDARFVSIERFPEKLAQARKNLERAGLLTAVELDRGRRDRDCPLAASGFRLRLLRRRPRQRTRATGDPASQVGPRRSAARRQRSLASRRDRRISEDGRVSAGIHLDGRSGGQGSAHRLATGSLKRGNCSP